MAAARPVHIYSEGNNIGTAGTGAGQLEGPAGIAVNSATTGPNAGDVYVADSGNNRIDVFKPEPNGSYTFVRAWGWGVVEGIGKKEELQTCTVLTGCGQGTAGSGAGQLSSPQQIAIDNSGSATDPSKEDVYVTTGDVVDKFTPTGAYLGQISEACPLGTSPPSCTPEPFAGLDGVAVDPNGELWITQPGQEDGQSGPVDNYSDAVGNEFVASREGHVSGNNRPSEHPGFAVDSEDDFYIEDFQAVHGFSKFNSAGDQLYESFAGSNAHFPNATGIAVDPANDNVYLDQTVGFGSNFFVGIEELTANDSVVESFGSAQLSGGGGGAVAVNAANETVYVLDGDAIEVYATVPRPDVFAGEASDLQTEGSATLNGTVDPDGLPLTGCEFEYVPVAAFQESNTVQTVTLSGATSGKFTLTFKGEKTNPIGNEERAHGLRAALEELHSIGESTGNVKVSGAEGGPYTIEFTGVYAHTNVPLLIAETYAPEPLEPAGATVTVQGTPGGWVTATTANCKQGQGEIGEGTSPVPVSAEVSGLTPDTLYDVRVDATNGNGLEQEQGEPHHFVAPAHPAISGEQASAVQSSTATLQAQVDPGGAQTSYYVEYGTSEPYAKTTAQSTGAGLEATGVQVQLSGLRPETEYHARVVAGNLVDGRVLGGELTFTTAAAAAPSAVVLPDGRVYELASPHVPGSDADVYLPEYAEPVTTQASVYGIFSDYPAQVAPDGEAVVYAGDAPPTTGEGDEFVGGGNEFLARHLAGGGWSTADIQPPERERPKYRAFSSDLSVGIVESVEPLAAGPLPENTSDFYAHPTAAGAGGAYDPLATGLAPVSSDYLTPESSSSFPPFYAGANAGTEGPAGVPAFSHRLFEATGALPSSPQARNGGSGEDNLYDSFAGQLYSVNVLPDGQPDPNATFGSPWRFQHGEEYLGLTDAISADGSRIFWTAQEDVEEEVQGTRKNQLVYKPKALYVREDDTSPGAATVQVDASTLPGTAQEKAAKGGGGQFWMASSDGSRVFFLDEKRLTSDSTAETGEPDLYEYEVNSEVGKPGALTDLTVETAGVEANAGEHADVQGVLGTGEGEDGSYVYFAADGVLATNKVNNGGGEEAAQPGRPNIYVSHEGDTTFVASGAGGESVIPGPGAGSVGDWQLAAGLRTAQVTPTGQGLLFMSSAPLTGYRNVLEGHELDEVYLYEAGSRALRCVSCNPTGAAPVPTEMSKRYPKTFAGGFFPYTRLLAYQTPSISEDGSRIFFDSAEPLVPQATSGYIGVYEWERDGTGTCAQSQGCIYLLSSPTNLENSYLIGTDATGDNVFFISRADLVAGDYGGDDDVVYDARVDGYEPPAKEACNGTGCQGVPPAPPIFATPASVTFSGTGNFPGGGASNHPAKVKTAAEVRAEQLAKALESCHKDKKKAKRQKCEKAAKKKYGAKASKAKKSAHINRRAK